MPLPRMYLCSRPFSICAFRLAAPHRLRCNRLVTVHALPVPHNQLLVASLQSTPSHGRPHAGIAVIHQKCASKGSPLWAHHCLVPNELSTSHRLQTAPNKYLTYALMFRILRTRHSSNTPRTPAQTAAAEPTLMTPHQTNTKNTSRTQP